jgi:hypothetical protein
MPWGDLQFIKKQRARRTCTWCNTAIEKGASCWRYFGGNGKVIEAWRVHPECRDAMARSSRYKDLRVVCARGHERGHDCTHEI